MSRLNGWRAALRNLLTAVCVVGVLLPVAALAAEPGEVGKRRQEAQERKQEASQQRGQVEQQIDDANANLSDIQRRSEATAAELSQIDAERQRLAAELAALGAELDGAQQALEDAKQALAATNSELFSTEDKLKKTRARLDYHRARFAERARVSYKLGGTGYAGLVLDVEDMNEFSTTVKYIRAVVASDREQMELVLALEIEVESHMGQLELLRDRQASERQAATAERDRVAAIVAERQEVQAAADAEAERHREALARLEADKESYVALVSELEADSQQIQQELAAIAQEEAAIQAAEEEARRKAEEEARRRAEAEAAAEARRLAQAEAAEEEARRREQEAAARAARERAAEQAPAEESTASQPVQTSTSQLQRPVSGPLTSGYGNRCLDYYGYCRLHAGVDFGAATGTPIYAAESGTVVTASAMSGYGLTVVVNHGGGLATLYAHQSQIAVSSGQSVSRGQVIGYVGSTGNSTGPHLHFEVRVNGSPVDPMGYL